MAEIRHIFSSKRKNELDKKMAVNAIMPFINDNGVGIQIYTGQPDIPVGIYHQDGISGTNHWRAAIAAILHNIEIHSDAVRYEFDSNVIRVTVPKETVCVAKFVKAIKASPRFIFVGAESERTASAA